LQAIKESLQPGQEWLFPGRSNGHLCTKTVLRTIERLGEEAGLQEVFKGLKLSRRKVTPLILRHSHVVNALMAGVPVPMIQKQLGHKRLSTTEIYTVVAPALVKEAYDGRGFGPLNEKKIEN
jgi:site-specific recombinase XerD